MPQESEKFPSTLASTTTTVSSLSLKSRRLGATLLSERSATTRPAAILRSACLRPLQCGSFLLLDVLLALGAYRQILARLFIQPRQIVILDGLGDYAPSGFGTEIVFVIKTFHPFHQLAVIEAGINGVR